MERSLAGRMRALSVLLALSVSVTTTSCVVGAGSDDEDVGRDESAVDDFVCVMEEQECEVEILELADEADLVPWTDEPPPALPEEADTSSTTTSSGAGGGGGGASAPPPEDELVLLRRKLEKRVVTWGVAFDPKAGASISHNQDSTKVCSKDGKVKHTTLSVEVGNLFTKRGILKDATFSVKLSKSCGYGN